MLDDKAYARAVRCHFVIAASLHQILLNKLVFDGKKVKEDELDSIKDVYNDMSDESMDGFDNASLESGCLRKIASILDEFKVSLSESSRTSKLWNQYLRSIGIMKGFI